MVSWEEAERRAELALGQTPKIDEHEARQVRKEQLRRERDAIVEEIHRDVKNLFKSMDRSGLTYLFKTQWKKTTVCEVRAGDCRLRVEANGEWYFRFEPGRTEDNLTIRKRQKTTYIKGYWEDSDCAETIVNNAEQLKDIARVLVAMLYKANNLPLPKE